MCYNNYYTLIRLEISHRTRCVIVYLGRDIPAFVMYYVYEASRSSQLIKCTDSMIIITIANIICNGPYHRIGKLCGGFSYANCRKIA